MKTDGFPIYSSTNLLVGAVDYVEHRVRTNRVVGWTLGGGVNAEGPDGSFCARLKGRRKDAEDALNGDDLTAIGFELDIPTNSLCTDIVFDQPGAKLRARLPTSPVGKMWFCKFKAAARFAIVCIRNIAEIRSFLQSKTEPKKAVLKRAFGFSKTGDYPVIDASLFEPRPCGSTAHQPITIVLPVYNAFDVLGECLQRVAAHTDTPWRLILIEDCSSDVRVRPFLRDWRAKQVSPENIFLIENATNLGFIRSVNKGLTIAIEYGDPVILLNSDALVPQNWASRLIAPLMDDRKIASVTPLSNDAEILTVPRICRPGPLAAGSADHLDQVACDTFGAGIQIPTGVGFCMAMSMRFLVKASQLDERFGAGYGEEVDWCQKARQLGGTHVCHTGLFVEHKGGQSFGIEQKRSAIVQNNQIISARYPNFDSEVATYIEDDPLIVVRLCLAIAERAIHQSRMPIYIGHSMGGGAERYLCAEISELSGRGLAAVVLRVGGTHRWTIELHVGGEVVTGVTNDFEVVLKVLEYSGPRDVIYSCAVGDCDPVQLPQLIERLVCSKVDVLSILFHDYFPISPSYCLMNNEGVYLGAPSTQTQDQAHQYVTSDGKLINLARWQFAWGRLLEVSHHVIGFSENSRGLIATAYPSIAHKIDIHPHHLPHIPERVRMPAKHEWVIGVLGDINLQKGAQIVVDLAHKLTGLNGRLVIIGNLDPAFSTQNNVLQTGSYEPEQISELASQYGVNAWLIPSIWPETFSYTTHEALATGLPVLGFALGAQGDVLCAAQNGVAMPLQNNKAAVEAIILELIRILSDDPAPESFDRAPQSCGHRGFAA